jgi:glyoxylase-like metal-dependent hydrolase (beta-lactamase superfamily II)
MRIHPISCGFGYAFLIEVPSGLFLVDSGSPGQEAQVLAKMKEIGRADLKAIWITHAHYDHYGSAAALRKATGAAVGVHPADAGYLAAGLSPLGSPCSYGFIYPLAQRLLGHTTSLPAITPDFTLEDGETLEDFGLRATVLHTPGHTPGHTCLLLEGGIALVGDLIGAFPWPRRQSLLATDWSQLQGSLDHLKSAHPQWIYTGHFARKIPASRLGADWQVPGEGS